MLSLLTIGLAALVGPGSDVRLEGVRLEAFLKTRGRSEVGHDVRWKIPAITFALPSRSRHGLQLFVHKGIGIVCSAEDSGLAEVRRRGGQALVRGRVVRAPEDPEKELRISTVIETAEIRSRPKPR
jgi:hypothetical protein